MQQNLAVYNTLSMHKEKFETVNPGKVNMFVCGPTVNDYIHVGHARTYIFYDVVARYLSHLGYKVNFLMNITDVDESITRNARQEQMGPTAYAERYAKAFLEDVKNLKILTVTKFERVSGYMPEIIRQISQLIEKKHAYVVGGEVFFDTTSFPDYGKLSHQSELELTLRPLEISPKKHNLLDFALWRPVSLVEGKWESPWGIGSPGWHIQDTAVTLTNFGPQYDLHGGAYELVYPHHEAEIAQAESATDVKPFVRYWIHTGLLTSRGTKMSKSAGNVMNVKDVLQNFSADHLRLYMLSLQYRKNDEFDEKKLKRIKDKYASMKETAAVVESRTSARARRRDSSKALFSFYEALNDDFDTPRAIEIMTKLAEDGAKEKDPRQVELYYESLRIASNILGVDMFGNSR